MVQLFNVILNNAIKFNRFTFDGTKTELTLIPRQTFLAMLYFKPKSYHETGVQFSLKLFPMLTPTHLYKLKPSIFLLTVELPPTMKWTVNTMSHCLFGRLSLWALLLRSCLSVTSLAKTSLHLLLVHFMWPSYLWPQGQTHNACKQRTNFLEKAISRSQVCVW